MVAALVSDVPAGGQTEPHPRSLSDPDPTWHSLCSYADDQAFEPESLEDRLYPPEPPPGAGPQLETEPVKSQVRQLEAWPVRMIQTQSMVARLREVGRDDLADPLAECGTEPLVLCCMKCGRYHNVSNHCHLKHCPNCQPALSRARVRSIRWWATGLHSPKHIVLTVRNTRHLNKAYVQAAKQCLSRLRRRAIFKRVTAGLWCLEVTNEGRGWHLHFHLLVEGGYIDARHLATIWAELVGQEFAIVKVKSVSGIGYLQEVTKYVAKGSELAAWDGHALAEFIDAFDGGRTWGVFGSLYGHRTTYKDWLDRIAAEARKCECGADAWRLYSDNEWQERLLKLELAETRPRPPPPPAPIRQLELAALA